LKSPRFEMTHTALIGSGSLPNQCFNYSLRHAKANSAHALKTEADAHCQRAITNESRSFEAGCERQHRKEPADAGDNRAQAGRETVTVSPRRLPSHKHGFTAIECGILLNLSFIFLEKVLIGF
jgi:hypothetical protein